MQSWSFPHTSEFVHNTTSMTKDNTLSQSLNNRLSDDPVFFVYDHNMLKKETDDLKDAILYFSPEFMSADDQCALCGQLMGMSEFLRASISESAPVFFKFDQEKFALKRIGSYSFGLQASVCIPDSIVSEQLMSLYEVFVTFHGSVDSVRLRFKESHAHFLTEFSNIWRVILQVSNVSLYSALSQTFNHVPCVQLPKSGSHLFQQASHLLQASQRRPFVLAGAIFYKNKVLCTQLSPVLTRHLTFLQNQVPYIARSTESEMPKGCKTITMFLTDNELNQITPLHPNSSRHCKSTDFHQPPKSKNNISQQKLGRKLTRRLTCSSVPTMVLPEKSTQTVTSNPEQTLKRYLSNEQFKSHHGKPGAMGVEKSSWGKINSKVNLSHVPLVECRSGESLSADDVENSGRTNSDSSFGQSYQQLELNHRLDAFTVDAPRKLSSKLEKNKTPQGKVLDNAGETQQDIYTSEQEKDLTIRNKRLNSIERTKSESDSKQRISSINDTYRFDPDAIFDIKHLEQTSNDNLMKDEETRDQDNSPTLKMPVSSLSIGKRETLQTGAKNDNETKINISEISDQSKSIQHIDENNSDYRVCGDRSEPNNDPDINVGVKTEPDTDINVDVKTETDTDINVNVKTETDPDINVNVKTETDPDINVNVKTETDPDINVGVETKTAFDINEGENENAHKLSDNRQMGDSANTCNIVEKQICEKEGVGRLFDLRQESVERLVSESEIETEDELEIVVDSFTPCIACLDLHREQSSSTGKNLKQKCEKCQAKPSVKQVIAKTGERQEVMDFGYKNDAIDSDSDEPETPSDIEGRHFYSAKSDTKTDTAGVSSFSSDVSTDSTISRYWNYEMEGLNDVTLYIQCHSEISLLLIMENPEHYEENLFNSLWKSSLSHLADLDYYLTECIENDESLDNDVNFKYARFDAFSSELLSNIEETTVKKREVHLQQMLSVLHSDFKDRNGLTDVTLRSQSMCCYGHHSHGAETYFQPEHSSRYVSGLPTPRDPSFNLDSVARQRLSEDKKMTLL